MNPYSVVEVIKAERAHQLRKHNDEQHSVGEWLLILEKKLDQAKLDWYGSDHKELYRVIQIAACCHALLEGYSRDEMLNLADIFRHGVESC